MAFHLRHARWRDSYTLWVWHNEPSTLTQFASTSPVPWREHVDWLTEHVANPDTQLYIAEDHYQPVGMIRFDTSDGWETASVSYTVARESRGREYGRLLLTEGVRELLKRVYQPHLCATVKLDNAASHACFAAAGWRRDSVAAAGLVSWHLSLKGSYEQNPS